MKPVFKLESNGLDITQAVASRLVSASLTDEAGVQSDAFEMTLDNRYGALMLPPGGAELKVWLGFLESGLRYMGLFVFDHDAEFSGPPDQVRLRATSAHVGATTTGKQLLASLKAPKTRSWHETTVGAVVAQIAAESGYAARVADSLAGLPLAHLDQTNESDLNLLTRLAQNHNAIAKPAGGFLLFAEKGAAKSIGGSPMPTVRVPVSALSSWRVQLSGRDQFGSAEAGWYDVGAAQQQWEKVGAEGPVKRLRANFPTAVEAQRAAVAELARLQRGTAALSASMPGRPELGAEGVLEITDGHPLLAGRWGLSKATHAFSSSGYTTAIEAERLEEA